MPQKLNNDRKYPDATRQPRHKNSFRVEEAKERQEAYDQLTPQQKLNRLDAKLGKDVGAVKQRAKLTAQITQNHTTSEQKGSAI